MTEYAIYQGDTFLFIGTAKECADRLNVSTNYIYFLTSPSGKKRFESYIDKNKAMTAVRLD